MTKKKSFTIDRDIFKISENNFYKEEYNKSLIILGSTNRPEDFYLKRQTKKDNKKSIDWNTYTITRDGNIYEHYNPIYYSEFIGDSIIDRKSVSVLLENMGHLYYIEDSDIYINDLNELYQTNDNIFTKEWRGYKYYEPYTKEQYDATVYLCRSLCLELNINDDSIGHNAYDDNAKNYNGIISRSNLDVNFTDLNPSFDFRKFLKDLKK
jgi:hypothetical protein